MKATGSCEILIRIYETTRRHIPEDRDLKDFELGCVVVAWKLGFSVCLCSRQVLCGRGGGWGTGGETLWWPNQAFRTVAFGSADSLHIARWWCSLVASVYCTRHHVNWLMKRHVSATSTHLQVACVVCSLAAVGTLSLRCQFSTDREIRLNFKLKLSLLSKLLLSVILKYFTFHIRIDSFVG
jgi:hypothetical protein